MPKRKHIVGIESVRTTQDLAPKTLLERLQWIDILEVRSEHYKTGVDPKESHGRQFFHAPRSAVGRLCRIAKAAAVLVEATDAMMLCDPPDPSAAKDALAILVKELQP